MNEDIELKDWDSLQRRVRELERRVAYLEGEKRNEPETSMVPQPVAVSGPGEAVSQPAVLVDAASAVPVLGRSLLALAGAYLLRALTEMGALPAGVGITVGIAYATVWLGLAARTAPERKLNSIMYSLASVLILTPLIWEATVRFKVSPTALSAFILTSFTVLGLAISWRRNLTYIAWIATLAGVLTAVGLIFATFDLMPFTFGLLAIAAAVEASACFEHWLKERLLVATVTDFAVLLATYLITRPSGIPEAYVPFTVAQVVGAQAALLTVYLASAIVRTLWRGLPFTNVEIFQCAVAFLIGIGGSLRAAKGTQWEVALCLFTLLCGVACYVVAFNFLERKGEHGRNFYIYSSFGLLLVVGGTSILLTAATAGIALPLQALAFVWIGERWLRSTLIWHGTAYLLLGVLMAATLTGALSLLLGTATGWSTLNPGLVCACACGVLCCRIVSHSSQAHLTNTLLMVALASLLAGGALCAVLTSPLTGSLMPYAATVRTAVILGTVWVLARSAHPAHRWAGIGMMVAGGYKMVAQEFRADATMPLFLSLLLCGGMLLILPRLLQRPGAEDRSGGVDESAHAAAR
ncbi:MAG: hypothetical protein JNL98_24170 [Bryobacterales bacterium]|nr:hypothetical protein [Bryobacterales bacterium]